MIKNMFREFCHGPFKGKQPQTQHLCDVAVTATQIEGDSGEENMRSNISDENRKKQIWSHKTQPSCAAN